MLSKVDTYQKTISLREKPHDGSLTRPPQFGGWIHPARVGDTRMAFIYGWADGA